MAVDLGFFVLLVSFVTRACLLVAFVCYYTQLLSLLAYLNTKRISQLLFQLSVYSERC